MEEGGVEDREVFFGGGGVERDANLPRDVLSLCPRAIDEIRGFEIIID